MSVQPYNNNNIIYIYIHIHIIYVEIYKVHKVNELNLRTNAISAEELLARYHDQFFIKKLMIIILSPSPSTCCQV